MRRLTQLTVATLVVACSHPASSPVEYRPSAPADRELLPDEQVQQALNRLAYGGRPGEAAKVRAMGVDRWIDAQLHPETIPDDSATALVARYTSLSVPATELAENFRIAQQARRRFQQQQPPPTANDTTKRPPPNPIQAIAGNDPKLREALMAEQRSVPELQAASLTRAVASERQLYEVMVNFWENHFSVYAQKGPQERIYLSSFDRDVIRPNAMGKFRDLLGAVAHSPAMLFYLDNWQSVADSMHPTLAPARGGGRGRGGFRPGFPPPPQRRAQGLNENYARELMELHTLGVDGGYTQKDVIEVARALTGWTIGQPQGGGGYLFRPEAHDAAEKTVLGHTLAAGRGEQDGEDVLDIVARHPSTARFITTKLARHFVSDEPPKALVDRCSKVFTKTDGDIRQTVGCVVTSPEFFSRAAYRAKVKTPFEVVASALRAVNAVPDATPRSAQMVAQLGQPIFGHQTPEGWPDRADAWMNSGAILNRINFGLMVASGRIPGVQTQRVPAIEALRMAPRDSQVDGVARLLLGGQISPDTRQVLMSGENPLASSMRPDTASMMNDMRGPPPFRPLGGGGGRGGPPPMPTTPINLQGLSQVIGLALGAPEFQRR